MESIKRINNIVSLSRKVGFEEASLSKVINFLTGNPHGAVSQAPHHFERFNGMQNKIWIVFFEPNLMRKLAAPDAGGINSAPALSGA